MSTGRGGGGGHFFGLVWYCFLLCLYYGNWDLLFYNIVDGGV